MSVADRLEHILARLTPEYLRDIVLRLSAAQTADTRASVSLPGILDAVAEGADLGTGAQGWAAHLRLIQAIKDTVGQIAGMQYVEGDS